MIRTVLFAEDDKEFAKSTKVFLEAGGWTVQWVNDGKKARVLYERQKPDVLLLDLNMPKLDGLGLIRQVRETDEGTPIVLYSGKISDSEVVEALEAGANDVVRKGVNAKELLARLKKQHELASVYPGRAHVYVLAEGVEFNSLSGVLKTKERQQVLKGPEATLLKLLCARMNEWVSKEFLNDILWAGKTRDKEGRLQKCAMAVKDVLKEAEGVMLLQEGEGLALQVG